MRLAQRGDADWITQLIKVGETHGVDAMREFFWQVVYAIIIHDILKRLVNHFDKLLSRL